MAPTYPFRYRDVRSRYQVCIRCVSGMYQVGVSGVYQVCIRSVYQVCCVRLCGCAGESNLKNSMSDVQSVHTGVGLHSHDIVSPKFV